MNQPSCLVVRETWVYLCAGNERPPSSHFSTFQTQSPVGSYVMIITPSASSSKCESRVWYYLHTGESSKHSGAISSVHVTPPPKQSLLFFCVRDIQTLTVRSDLLTKVCALQQH